MNARPNERSAFTLIELLVVIAILAILLGLIVSPVAEFMRSSGIVNAGDQLQATLSHARQLAAARNRTVEVRFYKYTDPAIPSPNPDGRFYALQLFLIDPTPQGTTTVATGKKVTLPNTVYLASTRELSSLLDPSISTHASGSTLGSIQPCGTNYTAATFRVYPDGSTNLPIGAPVFLTVVPVNTEDNATTPPVNFATLVLQPSTAKVRLHRP